VVINEELDISRQRIDVEVRQLGVKWVKRRNEKPILRNINARFPSGQVTAVLVSYSHRLTRASNLIPRIYIVCRDRPERENRRSYKY